MHGVTVPFFELLTVGLLLRALKRQRLLDYTLAGLSIGHRIVFLFFLPPLPAGDRIVLPGPMVCTPRFCPLVLARVHSDRFRGNHRLSTGNPVCDPKSGCFHGAHAGHLHI